MQTWQAWAGLRLLDYYKRVVTQKRLRTTALQDSGHRVALGIVSKELIVDKNGTVL